MVPEIHKLAITPDTETLVCILRDKEEERGPGSVFHAPISTLAELANNRYAEYLPYLMLYLIIAVLTECQWFPAQLRIPAMETHPYRMAGC